MIVAGEEKRRNFREAGWWGDQTLADLFFANATKHPERLTLIDAPNRPDFAFGAPRRLTYAQMREEVERFAGALLAAGIGKDDVIVIQLPNMTEFVSLYFAAATIGAIVSPVAVQYRTHELSAMFGIVEPKAFICGTQMKGADHIGTVRPLLKRGNIKLMTIGPDAPSDAIDLDAEPARPELLRAHCAATKIDADDVFTICWTSGTTGIPKGVPRSHNHWVGIAPATYITSQLQDGEVMLNPFPLINMGSIGGVMMSWLRVAGTMVLHHPFDPQVYLTQIATERPSFTIAPPAVLNMLLQNEALLAKVDLSSLRTIGSGSAPLAPAMVQGFQERLNLPVINIFGSNEGMSLITAPDTVPDPVERASYFPNGLDLKPYYGADSKRISETRLVPADGGAVIEDEGVPGELQIRGPTVFEGYWNAPEQTAAAFTEDGWFKTGDVGKIDERGYVTIVGRSKDLIISGGYNVYPAEIEGYINDMPGVAESALVGVPHPDFGEVGVAVVIAKPGTHLSGEAVLASLKAQLANFKIPKKCFVLPELPRNTMGKVQKNLLREQYKSLFA